MLHQDLLHHLGMGAESEEKEQQVVCYGAEDETGELTMEERKESGELKLSTCFAGQLASLATWLGGS